jgi:transcriptional regulator with XRE-family HTH domain
LAKNSRHAFNRIDYLAPADTCFFIMTLSRKPTRTLHLRAWIKRLGLRQIDVASRAGISPAYITNLIQEFAERSPSTEVMFDIAEAISELSGVNIELSDLYRPLPSEEELNIRRQFTRDQIYAIMPTLQKLLCSRRR